MSNQSNRYQEMTLDDWADQPLKNLIMIFEKNGFSDEEFQEILELRDKKIELKAKSKTKPQKFSSQVDSLIEQGIHPLILLFRIVGSSLNNSDFAEWVVNSSFDDGQVYDVKDFYQSLIKLKKHLKGKALLDDFYQWKDAQKLKKEITVGEGKPVSEVIQPSSEEYYDEPDSIED